MLKFGTGQITHVDSDSEEGRQVRIAAVLTDDQLSDILDEGEEADTEGE